MSMIRTFTRDDFSDSLGLSNQVAPDIPSPWGVARLIRREVRRQSIVTRRELRRVIEPLFSAARFDGDTSRIVQAVADRMVEVGELADLKVENQRGYSAMPPRWIKYHENGAVLLGAFATETHQFSQFHPNQFLRRFHPSDNLVANLTRMGVHEQAFDDWFGQSGWMAYVDSSQPVNSLDELLDWYVNQLDTDGSPLRLDSSKILAVDHRPGDFFGSERKTENSRWVPCNQLNEGIYVGAQPGQNENHWIPLLIRIEKDASRTLEIHCGNNPAANIDLRNWLLVAIGARNQKKEIVFLDDEAGEVQCTFPIPATMNRTLCLLCEPTGIWQRYAASDVVSIGRLLNRYFPEIRIQQNRNS